MSLSLEELCQGLNTQNALMLIRACIFDAAESAESVLKPFEAIHPDDYRPRKAVEAARAVGDAIDRYLAGQAPWQEVEQMTEAVWNAAEDVSMHTLYTAKGTAAILAADAACHAANVAGEAVSKKAASPARSAACAAGSAAVCRWLVETGQGLSERAARAMGDEIYNVKCMEFCQRAEQMLGNQAESDKAS